MGPCGARVGVELVPRGGRIGVELVLVDVELVLEE